MPPTGEQKSNAIYQNPFWPLFTRTLATGLFGGGQREMPQAELDRERLFVGKAVWRNEYLQSR